MADTIPTLAAVRAGACGGGPVGVEPVVVVANPIAGRGAAARAADAVCAAIERAGIAAVRADSTGPGREGMAGAILPHAPARAIIVCGGDGSMHAVAGVAHDLGTPVSQVPMGTENLFARECGMDGRAEAVVAALQSGCTTQMDLGRCNGEVFLLMCSVGPDAAVVRRLAAARRGAISHLSYARHIAAELVRPTVTPVTIEVDGRVVVRDGVGWTVVANARQYALRIDPAADADVHDGMLDVVFLPARSSIGMARWALVSRMRAQSWGGSGRVVARGARVVVRSADDASELVHQVDGDAGPEGKRVLEFAVVPGGLGVVGGGKADSGEWKA